MISGAHAIVFTPAAAEVRDFFRETLGPDVVSPRSTRVTGG